MVIHRETPCNNIEPDIKNLGFRGQNHDFEIRKTRLHEGFRCVVWCTNIHIIVPRQPGPWPHRDICPPILHRTPA